MTSADLKTARRPWAPAFAVALVFGVGLHVSHPGRAGADDNTAGVGLDAAIGRGLFKRNWVPAPSSTKSNDGLGPLFNARSCQQCHAAGTAGRVETDREGLLADRGAVVRLGGPNGAPDPYYGTQIQTRAIQNHIAEAQIGVTWRTHDAVLDDGTKVALRQPSVAVEQDGAHQPRIKSKAGLVLAPSLIAAAQIARVDTAALAQARSLSGRLSRNVHGDVLVFGRKATEATLSCSIETAFVRDLGMSAGHHAQPAGDCTAQQTACLAGPHGDDGQGIEIAPEIVTALSAYVASLAPATRGSDDPEGATLFAATGCVLCHHPELPGKDGKPVRLYSDLRLHDMGHDLEAFEEVQGQTASEWRTSPLIGLQKRLAAGSTLLHDGRARTLEEAILWHSGEGQSARAAYARLSSAQRKALQHYVLSR